MLRQIASKPIHFKKRFKNSIKNRRNICERRRSFSCWRVAMRDVDRVGGAFSSRNQRRQDRPAAAAAAVVVAVAGWSRRWSGTQPAAHLNI